MKILMKDMKGSNRGAAVLSILCTANGQEFPQPA